MYCYCSCHLHAKALITTHNSCSVCVSIYFKIIFATSLTHWHKIITLTFMWLQSLWPWPLHHLTWNSDKWWHPDILSYFYLLMHVSSSFFLYLSLQYHEEASVSYLDRFLFLIARFGGGGTGFVSHDMEWFVSRNQRALNLCHKFYIVLTHSETQILMRLNETTDCTNKSVL